MGTEAIKAGDYQRGTLRAAVTFLADEAVWLARISGTTPKGRAWSWDAKLEVWQTVQDLHGMASNMAGHAADSLDDAPAREREQRL
jgi:hypothetical protein